MGDVKRARIRYWNCNESSGNLADQYGNTLTVNGSPAYNPTSVYPKFQTGITHSLTTQYFSGGGQHGIAQTGKATYAFWWKSAAAPIAWPVSTRTAGNGGFSILLYTTGLLYPYWGTRQLDTGLTLDVAAAGLYNNSWHHVAVTFDGTALETTVFIDGTEISGSPYTWVQAVANYSTTTNFTVFEYGAGTGNYTYSMDEIKAYNDILTDAEIAKLAAFDGVVGGTHQQNLVPA